MTATDAPTHAALVSAAVRWLRGRGVKVLLAEPRHWGTRRGQSPDVLGWSTPGTYRGDSSAIVECKASRSDFLADRRKPYHEHPEDYAGSLRWYFCAPAVATVDDLPPRWGLVEWAGPRRRPSVLREPLPVEQSARGVAAERAVLVAALRRHDLGAEWLSTEARFVPRFRGREQFEADLAARQARPDPQLTLQTAIAERRAAGLYDWTGALLGEHDGEGNP